MRFELKMKMKMRNRNNEIAHSCENEINREKNHLTKKRRIYRWKAGIGGGWCSCENHGMLQVSNGHSFWHNNILLILIGFFQRYNTIEFRHTST